jgi:hypothetical protein
VEEESDGRFGYRFPEELGQEHQVVVVDPDEVARAIVLDEGIAEAAVGLHVRSPALGVVDDAPGKMVEERPEGLVRIALIEALREREG